MTDPLSADVVAKLVGNHREFLAFLQRRVGDKAIAEDILQEAFVRSLPKLGELEQPESVLAWFYRVLRHAVTDHYRRGGARTRQLAALAAELEHETSDEELRGEVCRCVATLATTLKPEYAEVLQRVELDGVAVKDYAVEQGITTGNAAVRVFRAREALRRQLARSCGSCAEHGCLDCSCQPASGACH